MKSPETVAELIEWVGAGRRRRDELDFLPAALEILERPVSIHARAIALSIVAMVASAILWAALCHVDIVASADGKIVPSGQVKTIQPFDTGLVRRILVEEGQHVRAGQVLIELDPTSSRAEMERVARDLEQARLDAARLEALLGGRDRPLKLPAELPPSVAVAEQHMLEAERQEQEAKLAGLDREIDAKRAEREGAAATVSKLEATIPLIAQRVAGKKELLAKQYASLFSYLELKQQLVESQHELLVQRHQVEELGSVIAALARQRDETAAGFRKDALDRLIKARQQADQLVQAAIKAKQASELQTLTAPVDGTVQQLVVHTVGGVVTPAQPLMVVVPDDVKLEIEARIPNRDIGFVHEGEDAEIKIATFDFTHYGVVHGRVIGVSRDAIPPEDKEARQQELTYAARISLDKTRMVVDGREVALGSGMMVTAEIKTGRRRIIDYLLSPVMRYREQSLRER